MTLVLAWRVSRCNAEAVFILPHGHFRHAVRKPGLSLVPGLVPLLIQEGLREGDERTGVALSVGQVGRAVCVAVEDEEVLALDNATVNESAKPARLLVGCG